METLFSELQFNYRCLLSGRFKIFCSSSILKSSIQDPTFHFTGTTLERGAEGALVPPEFGGSEKRTERETDNLLLIAPPESKF